MFIPSAICAFYFAAALATSSAATSLTVDASALWGTWELTGIGQAKTHGAPPNKMVFVFDAAGWRELLWEDDGITRHEYPGSYMLSGDVLELTGPRDYRERFRIASSSPSLILEPIEESPKGPPIQFHFEKRAWVSP